MSSELLAFLIEAAHERSKSRLSEDPVLTLLNGRCKGGLDAANVGHRRRTWDVSSRLVGQVMGAFPITIVNLNSAHHPTICDLGVTQLRSVGTMAQVATMVIAMLWYGV